MIKKIILAALLILVSLSFISIVSAENQQSLIFMTLNYNDNQVTVKEMALGNGFYMPFAEDANVKFDKCTLKVYDKNGEIFETFFYVENKRFEDITDPYTGEMSGAVQELNNVDFPVIIPYFRYLERIGINCPSNNIILNHTDITFKPLIIPAYGQENYGQGNDAVVVIEDAKADQIDNTNNYADNSSASNTKQKSFFLQLVEVIEGVFYYIFG